MGRRPRIVSTPLRRQTGPTIGKKALMSEAGSRGRPLIRYNGIISIREQLIDLHLKMLCGEVIEQAYFVVQDQHAPAIRGGNCTEHFENLSGIQRVDPRPDLDHLHRRIQLCWPMLFSDQFDLRGFQVETDGMWADLPFDDP